MILQDKAKLFSYLGLLPFIFIPIIVWINPSMPGFFITSFMLWSQYMAIFLSGTLWAYALMQKKGIIPSVFLFSLSTLVVLTLKVFPINNLIQINIVLITLLLVYEGIYFFEKKLIKSEKWYRDLRFFLTFAVRICHLVMIAFIFTYQ